MQNLKAANWEDWETISQWMLRKLVLENYKVDVRFARYGTGGQGQHGIDLVAQHVQCPVVGQCKFYRTQLTWPMIMKDLALTASYPFPIEQYIVLADAAPHTSVLDVFSQGEYRHQRPDGTSFQVRVIYWQNVHSLDFIPTDVLQRLFPEAWRVTATLAPAAPAAGPEYLTSLHAVRRFIPSVITRNHLDWLETWDFSRGYVDDQVFGAFHDLQLEYERTLVGVKRNPEWLHEGHRLAIAATFPAGHRFLKAVQEFVSTVNASAIGGNLPDNTMIMTLGNIPKSQWPSITRGWASAAAYLASVYRKDVLGEPGD